MSKTECHKRGIQRRDPSMARRVEARGARDTRALFTCLVALTGLFLTACGQTGPADGEPSDTTEAKVTGTLSWKGLTWNITNGGMAGIAQGSSSNVFVDANGYLHLKITNAGGVWTASELFSTTKLGFGTYQWQIEGPVDRMDPSVVLGLFPYGPAAGIGADGTNELDQEFAFWNHPTGTNFGWTFYPATGSQVGEKAITFSLNGGNAVTSRMVWSSTSVVGSLLSGFQPVTSNTGLISSWTYAPANPTTNIPQDALPLGMNLWLFESPPASGKNVEIVLRDFQFVPQGTGTGTGTDTNIAPSGTGYLWSKNTTSTSDANRVANVALNDGNLSTSVTVNAAGEGGAALWESGGVLWSSAKTLSSAKFVNGKIDSYGNGYFQGGTRLQFTTDGKTWTDSGWSISPAYPNTSAAGGQTYTFTGTAKSGVLGARITGQTGASSWSGSFIETQFIGH